MKATIRIVGSEVLKTVVAIQGDAKNDTSNDGVAIIRASPSVFRAMARASAVFLAPMLEEMKRVAAVGSASWVRVVKTPVAPPRSDTCPI